VSCAASSAGVLGKGRRFAQAGGGNMPWGVDLPALCAQAVALGSRRPGEGKGLVCSGTLVCSEYVPRCGFTSLSMHVAVW
jgi:hypothetical protein